MPVGSADAEMVGPVGVGGMRGRQALASADLTIQDLEVL
jgi:hypothetical protein